MDWLNLHIPSALRSPEFVGSSPAERGTWLSVLGYAATIESGGRIRDAISYKDRQWQQACGVTLREIKAASRLIHFDGKDAIVKFYPIEKEKEVKAKRIAGKARASKMWGSSATSSATSSANNSAYTEGEGEGEREGEGESQPRGEGRERGVDAGIFQAQLSALASATEGELLNLSRRAARNVDAALREIRQLCPDLTAGEIDRRASNFRAHFRTAALTAQALANHWARCDAPPADVSSAKKLETDMPHAELMRRHGGTF